MILAPNMCLLLNVCVHAGNNPPTPSLFNLSNMDPCIIRRIDVKFLQIGTILTGKTKRKWEVISTTETETGRAAEQKLMREMEVENYLKRSWDCVHINYR